MSDQPPTRSGLTSEIIQSIVQLVKDVGFPIVVSGYLLYRMDSLMSKVIETQQELARQMMILTELIRTLIP